MAGCDRSDDRPIQLIEPAPQWSGPSAATLRRRLAVLLIEVPSAANGSVPIHEVAKAATLPSIEVLETKSAPAVGPGCKVGAVAEELIRAFDPNSEFSKEGVDRRGIGLGGDDLFRSVLGDVGTHACSK